MEGDEAERLDGGTGRVAGTCDRGWSGIWVFVGAGRRWWISRGSQVERWAWDEKTTGRYVGLWTGIVFYRIGTGDVNCG